MSLELCLYIAFALSLSLCDYCARFVCFFSSSFVSRLIRFSLICLSCFSCESFLLHTEYMLFIYNASDVSVAPLFLSSHLIASIAAMARLPFLQFICVSCEPNWFPFTWTIFILFTFQMVKRWRERAQKARMVDATTISWCAFSKY